MSRPKHYIFAITTSLLFFIMFTSCGYSPDKKLVEIEHIIEEFPDSALSLIEMYDIHDDSSEGDIAFYNLLLSYARYKNFIDEKNDSSIRKSADYFIKNGTPSRAAMSCFTMGMTQLNAKKYGEAVVSFNIGFDIAAKHGLSFWEGQCARGLFLLYGELHDSSAQLIYAQKEQEVFSKAGIKPWSYWSILDVGSAFNNNGQYEKSIKTTEKILKDSNCQNDSLLLAEAYAQIAAAQFSLGQFEKAISNYLSSYEFRNDLESNGMAILSIAVSEVDTIHTTKNLSSLADKIFENSNDSESFSVLAGRGDYKGAYWDLIKYKNMQDSALSVIVHNNVSESLHNYKKTNEIIAYKQRINERLLWIVLIFSMFIIVGVIVLMFRRRMNQKEFVLQKYIGDMESLKVDFADLLNKNKLLSDSIIQSILEKYKRINALCDEYYEKQFSKEKKVEYEILINRIKTEFNDEECLLTIKKDVDKYTKGLFSSFNNDFPDLSKDDVKLYMFFLLGFSPRTISVILNVDISNVYNRKSRLKKKIHNAGFIRSDEYLEGLR